MKLKNKCQKKKQQIKKKKKKNEKVSINPNSINQKLQLLTVYILHAQRESLERNRIQVRQANITLAC